MNEIIEDDIIDRIAYMLKIRAIRQMDFAEEMGVDASKVSMMLHRKKGGLNTDSVAVLSLAAKVLNIDLSWLLFGERENAMSNVWDVEVPGCVYEPLAAVAKDMSDDMGEEVSVEDIVEDIEVVDGFVDGLGRLKWYIVTRLDEDGMKEMDYYAVSGGRPLISFSGCGYSAEILKNDWNGAEAWLDGGDVSEEAYTFLHKCVELAGREIKGYVVNMHWVIVDEVVTRDLYYKIMDMLADYYGGLAYSIEVYTGREEIDDKLIQFLDGCVEDVRLIEMPEEQIEIYNGKIYASIIISEDN